MLRWRVVLLISLLWLLPLAALRAQTSSGVKPSKEQLDKLFQDVKLPPGDPLPDFIERPWLPPSTDVSKHNKRGTDFGPAVAFTLQLSPKQWIRRGFTVRLPGNQAVCYDLDTLGVAATWQGGFLDFSQTHFEDAKGKFPGRPGGTPALWIHDAPGWADGQGSVADSRPKHLGPLPPEQVRYHGHFLHGYRVILSYDVLGRQVLEMPGVEAGDWGGLLPLSRTFYVAAGERPLRLIVARGQRQDSSTFQVGDQESLAVWVSGRSGEQPGRVNLAGESVVYEVPASTKPLSFRLTLVRGPVEKIRQLRKSVRPELAPPMDLRNWVRGGEGRWKKTLVTQGQLGRADRPYTEDTLTLPVDNPWKCWLRPAALGFFSDGRLAWSSMNGDVWIVSGIEGQLGKLTWRRFATGLYEPLGLKIVNDKLHVLGRDRITRLHDLDGDGEADFYESFHAGGVVSPGYHAFAFDLVTDSKSNFYYLKSGRKADDTPDNNALLRVSPDGKKWEVVATGFRHPNGMGIGPKDEIVVSDNQGEWVPASKVSLIREGGFYGYGQSEKTWQRPLFWLPMKMDNSSGGQFWAGPNWGPLSGKMLHTSYGTCKLFYVLKQLDSQGPVQATVIPLDLTFLSGIMRGCVNPIDGQVYLAGLNGWGSSAKKDGCLQRVRYTGQPACLVENVQVMKDAIQISFNTPVHFQSAAEVANYQLEQWNYIFSKKYGSPEMSVADPAKKGRDPVKVQSVSVGNYHRQVVLHIPGLRPVDQLRIQVAVRSAQGSPVQVDLYLTLHRIP